MSRWLPGFGNDGPAGSPAGSAADSPESPLLSSGSGGHDIDYYSPPPFLDKCSSVDVEHAIFEGVSDLEIEMNRPINNDDDVMLILNELKKKQRIIDALREVSDNEKKNDCILLFLDELNCYRHGCAMVQLRPLTEQCSDLQNILQPPTPIEDVPLTALETIKKTAHDAFTSAKICGPSDRKARYKKLKTQLSLLENKRLELMENSFFARHLIYKDHVLTAIETLTAKHPNVESFCGEARFLEVTPIRLVRFQLNIRRSNGNQELILGCLPQPSPADEVSIMNQLLSYLLGNQSERVYSPIKIDRLEPMPMDKKSCCNMLGGAKKIKRTRQSKKKKARRSKSKSKRVRRKNKSRRN